MQNDTGECSEAEYVGGIYSDRYTTLQQIGKGAYGCVKMAYRNTDRLLVCACPGFTLLDPLQTLKTSINSATIARSDKTMRAAAAKCLLYVVNSPYDIKRKC